MWLLIAAVGLYNGVAIWLMGASCWRLRRRLEAGDHRALALPRRPPLAGGEGEAAEEQPLQGVHGGVAARRRRAGDQLHGEPELADDGAAAGEGGGGDGGVAQVRRKI